MTGPPPPPPPTAANKRLPYSLSEDSNPSTGVYKSPRPQPGMCVCVQGCMWVCEDGGGAYGQTATNTNEQMKIKLWIYFVERNFCYIHLYTMYNLQLVATLLQYTEIVGVNLIIRFCSVSFLQLIVLNIFCIINWRRPHGAGILYQSSFSSQVSSVICMLLLLLLLLFLL